MDEIITLDYGSGGKKTSELIENLIVKNLKNDALAALGDGAVLSGAERIVFSTDSFVVSPCFFPGGDIGKLCVCGTVNDVAMSGGIPKYLSLSFIIEEGFPVSALEKIIESVKNTAEKAGVSVVTGDTKVVERGRGDGIYINTAGIGFLRHPDLSPENLRKGDKVILSGTAGDHGAAIMLARNKSLADGEILSDCAPLGALAEKLFALPEGKADINALLEQFPPEQVGTVTAILLDDKNTEDKKNAAMQPLKKLLEAKQKVKQSELLESEDLAELDRMLKQSEQDKRRNQTWKTKNKPQ